MSELLHRSWDATSKSRYLVMSLVLAACAGNFTPADTARADSPCDQWRFDGYTQVIQSDGWKLTFTADGESAKEPATAFNGDERKSGAVDIGVYGKRVFGRFNTVTKTRPGTYPAVVQYDGAIDDAGFAYGTSASWFEIPDEDSEPINTTNDRWEDYMAFATNASWKSAQPLKCSPQPPDDVLAPAGVHQYQPGEPSPFGGP